MLQQGGHPHTLTEQWHDPAQQPEAAISIKDGPL